MNGSILNGNHFEALLCFYESRVSNCLLQGCATFLSVGHITNFRHAAGPQEKFSFFMYTSVFMYIRIFLRDGEKSDCLARAKLNVLAGRVVARGPPVAHPLVIGFSAKAPSY